VSWFKRLADVPGVSYTSSPEVNRPQLPGHDSVPQKREFDSTDVHTHHLMWPGPDEGSTTSASPARQHTSERPNEIQDPRRVLLELYEVLDLPGQLSDYHCAIQSTYTNIFERRREDLAMLEEVERLCWLDIELLEAYPGVVEYEPGKFSRVLAYEGLASLYETEGDFAGALEVAERGMRLDQEYLSAQAERLRARLAELEAEDMPW
jgi:hypothetical protein